MTKRILTDNLRGALWLAIDCQKQEEQRRNGPNFESCAVAGWREILEAIDRGEQIVVSDQ